jgi:hypothetical protein
VNTLWGKQTSLFKAPQLGLFAPAIDEQCLLFLFTSFQFLSLFHWLFFSNLSPTSISFPHHVYLLDTIY